MKRYGFILAASAVIMLGLGGAALGAESYAEHKAFGPGFHSVEAPIGFRYWLSAQKLAVDLGFGFDSQPAGIDPTEKEKAYALELGVPIVCHSWERAHALIRPGILYQSQQIGFDADPGPGFQFDTDNEKTLDLLLEGEAEVFLVENVSVSAAHGFRYRRFTPAFGGDSESSFGTRGNNFTTIGFHIYMY
jgi:hypothetical protein